MINLSAAIQEFLTAKRVEDASPKTVKWYANMLQGLDQRLGKETLTAISAAQLRDYIMELRTRSYRTRGKDRQRVEGGLSPDSLRGHIRGIKIFFGWCQVEYALDATRNPMLKIKIPKEHRREPKAAHLDDLHKLMNAIEETPTGKRTWAMLCFSLDTGCRLGEMLSLELERLDMDRREARVIAKGGNLRRVYFGEDTTLALLAWFRLRPTGVSQHVFVTVAIGRRAGKPLTPSAYYTVLRDLKRKARVSGRVNPHSLRHLFARGFLEQGGNLASLSQLMGHSSSEITTRHYAVFADSDLKDVHREFSPIGQLAGMRKAIERLAESNPVVPPGGEPPLVVSEEITVTKRLP